MTRPAPAALIPIALAAILISHAAAPGVFAADPLIASGRSSMTERVTVTASRLPDQEQSSRDVPALVTVITREDIVRSGARTLQELLALETGIITYDGIGNDRQLTFDMRGFAGGTGTAVFLDGARLNDPRNNGVSLDLIPLDSIERIEIVRGSVAATAGGGSEAGAVNIMTRRGDRARVELSAAAGSDGGALYSATLGGSARAFDMLISGSRDENDGFRTNAGGTQDRYAASFGFDLGAKRRLALSLLAANSELGAPGALTLDELSSDRDGAPFNRLDRSEDRLRQGTLNFTGPVGRSTTLAANLFRRGQEAQILTTGRAAPVFGGFFLDSDTSVSGSTVQFTVRQGQGIRPNGLESTLTFGGEWLSGDVDSLGFFTSPTSPGRYDRDDPDSKNTTGRRTTALFVQQSVRPVRWLTLTAGLRQDRDRVSYDEKLPDSSIDDSKTFSENSFRFGASFNPSGSTGYYLSYGEAFLPPTVEQLFSFPLFGSNPKLRPEDSRSWEAGARGSWGGGTTRAGSWDLALFRIDTENEIVFDPAPVSNNQFGMNVNAGRTRRQGIEGQMRMTLSRWAVLFLNAALTDAQITSGDDRGSTVPLVPKQRATAGVDVDLPGGARLRYDLRYVGDQVLANDEPNRQQRLDSYVVSNLRGSWLLWGKTLAAAPGAETGVSLFASVTNLFDERYSTRGIYAFDFSTSSDAVFLTPAPGRRWLAGLEWSF